MKRDIPTLHIPDEKPLRAQRCETCACWAEPATPQDILEKVGSCRANYPITVPIPSRTGQMGAMSIFPPLQAHQWCRKWEPVTN